MEQERSSAQVAHPGLPHPGGYGKAITVLLVIGFSFVLWGIFIFYTVGDRLPHPWYFGGIEDVPGKSPYSTSTAKRFFHNPVSPEVDGRVARQHVMEADGERP
jgi:hypothetical protein